MQIQRGGVRGGAMKMGSFEHQPDGKEEESLREKNYSWHLLKTDCIQGQLLGPTEGALQWGLQWGKEVGFSCRSPGSKWAPQPRRRGGVGG